MTVTYRDEANRMNITLREPHGDDIEMRPLMGLGLNPLVLIEFEQGETPQEMTIDIDATGPSTRQELGEFLAAISHYLLDPNMVEHPITEEGNPDEGE